MAKDILFIQYIPESIREKFKTKLIEISEDLDVNPDWIMVAIATESGFKSDALNEYGCSGLIQFCPDVKGGSTKKIGGETYKLSSIRAMNHYKQLDLIYEYYKPFQNKINNVYDLKLATFYPKAIGEDRSYILGSHNGTESSVYNANKSLAQNGHKYIQVKDIYKVVDDKISKISINKESDTLTKGKKLLFRFYYIPLALGVIALVWGLNKQYKWVNITN